MVHEQQSWYGVANLLQYQARGNHRIKSCRGTEIHATNDEDDGRVGEQSPYWYAKTRVDLSQEMGADESVVTRERPGETRGCLLAAEESEDSTPNEKGNKQRSHGMGAGCLRPDLVDWYHRWCGEDSVEVAQSVGHCDDECEARYEPDKDRGHQRSWHCNRGILAFFGEMNGAIDAGVDVVRVDEAGQENDAVRGPAGGVQEVGPDKGGGLF